MRHVRVILTADKIPLTVAVGRWGNTSIKTTIAGPLPSSANLPRRDSIERNMGTLSYGDDGGSL